MESNDAFYSLYHSGDENEEEPVEYNNTGNNYDNAEGGASEVYGKY